MHGGMLLAVQSFRNSEGTDIQLGPAIGGTWEHTFAGTSLMAVAGSRTGAGIGLGLRGGLRFGRFTFGLNGQSILGTKHSHSEAMLIAGYQFQ